MSHSHPSPTPPAPGTTPGVVVHRPTWAAFWVSAKTRVLIFGAAILFLALRSGPSGLVAVVVALAVAGAGFAVFLRTATVTVTPTSVSYRRLGRTSTVALDGRQRGLLCMMTQGVQGIPWLGVVGPGGERVGLSGAYFDGAVLGDVAARAGVTVVPAEQRLTGKEAHGLAPGSVPALLHRPALVALIATPVVVGVIAVIAILTI